MNRSTRGALGALVVCLSFLLCPVFAAQQQPIELTLESAVDIAMKNSYRIQQLKLGIERIRLRLKARQAQLKSSMSMNLKVPQFEALSDYKWNSTLKRDEIVRQNTRLWEMGLSISQPVLLLGQPTNGYLSLNSRTYRYSQREDGTAALNYYNRYYLSFNQPLFRPNQLKNDIEAARLDLEREDLNFLSDQAALIDDIADDYYDLFALIYQDTIYAHHVEHLEHILRLSEELAHRDSTRAIEPVQVQVELGNAQEQLLKNRSQYRLEIERLKQRLRLGTYDELYLRPTISIHPITVNLEEAMRFGLSLRPSLRRLYIDKRKEEIDLSNTKGNNSFHIDLQMTYGMEKQEEEWGELWHQYDNSYSVAVNAFVPLWDWGRRDALVAAEQISVKSAQLSIDEVSDRIINDIANSVQNVQEYQRRALSMKENLDRAKGIAAKGIEQYAQQRLSLQDLLRSVSTQRDTDRSFLDAYMGYRRSLLSLMIETYYDYENDISLLDRFHAQKPEEPR